LLQLFYLDVAYVYNGFQVFSDVFASVSNACYKCFIGLLLYVLQVLHLDILKVNQMLHIEYAWEAEGGLRGSHAGDVRANNNF
jgi:hypothetical protein